MGSRFAIEHVSPIRSWPSRRLLTRGYGSGTSRCVTFFDYPKGRTARAAFRELLRNRLRQLERKRTRLTLGRIGSLTLAFNERPAVRHDNLPVPWLEPTAFPDLGHLRLDRDPANLCRPRSGCVPNSPHIRPLTRGLLFLPSLGFLIATSLRSNLRLDFSVFLCRSKRSTRPTHCHLVFSSLNGCRRSAAFVSPPVEGGDGKGSRTVPKRFG